MRQRHRRHRGHIGVPQGNLRQVVEQDLLRLLIACDGLILVRTCCGASQQIVDLPARVAEFVVYFVKSVFRV